MREAGVGDVCAVVGSLSQCRWACIGPRLWCGDTGISHISTSIQLLETISGGPVSHSFVDVKLYSHLWANISAGSSESQETHAAARSCATIIITS